MPHWLDGVSKILESDSENLRELATIAGLDPSDLYAYVDLSGCDLRGQDLRGMDFTGSRIEACLIDSLTQIDAEYDPRNKKIYKKIKISRPLLNLINIEASNRRYNYAIWHAKSLCESGSRLLHFERFRSTVREVYSRSDLSEFYRPSKGNRFYVRKIQLSLGTDVFINEYMSEIDESSRYPLIMFCAMLHTYHVSLDDFENGVSALLNQQKHRARDMCEF